MNNRNETLESSFITPPAEMFGLKLRPFSLGSMQICRKLKLTMLTGDAKPEDLSEEEQQVQIVAFLFIQSKPVPDVLSAIRSPNFRDDVLLPFSMELPLAAIPAAVEEIKRVMNEAGAAYVEVQPKPDEKPEDAPPNSLSQG